MKKNKVAIFLRGHKRTWDWLKSHAFETFESVYGNDIDWYVATWKSKTTTYNGLLNDFKDKNLKSLHVLNESEYPMPTNLRNNDVKNSCRTWTSKRDSYWRLAYLDLFLGHDKLQHELETNTKYDIVIFSRFDLYYSYYDVETEQTIPAPFTFSSVTNEMDDLDYTIFSDYKYKTDSITADILSFRFFDTHINDYRTQAVPVLPEVMLSNYLFRNNIAHNKDLNTFNAVSHIIRPDQLEIIDSILNTKPATLTRSPWRVGTVDYHLYHCKQRNIDPIEYNIFSD